MISFNSKGDSGPPGRQGDKGLKGEPGFDGVKGDDCVFPAANLEAGHKGALAICIFFNCSCLKRRIDLFIKCNFNRNINYFYIMRVFFPQSFRFFYCYFHLNGRIKNCFLFRTQKKTSKVNQISHKIFREMCVSPSIFILSTFPVVSFK